MEAEGMTKYRVIFKGKTVGNIDIDTVKKHLSRFFKNHINISEELFSGQTVVIKKSVDYQAAVNIKNAAEKIGAVFEIVPVATSNPVTIHSNKGDEPLSGHRVDDNLITCPKCGVEQQRSKENLQISGYM